jgi:hypothetical protein
MLPMLLAPIVSMLADKGLSLLSSTLGNLTDKGIEKAAEFVKDKTGIDITNEKAVAAMTPEQVLELKKLETENAKFFEGLAMEYYKIDAQDRQSARQMQMTALQQEDLFSKRFLYYYAMAMSGFAALYIAAVTFVPIPEANIRFADTILGFLLGTVISAIIQFFFGSSWGSQEKTRALGSILKKEEGK